MSDKIDIIFESMPESTTFNGDNTQMTWTELRGQLIERLLKLTPILHEQGIKKVEVGSIMWFYRRNKTRGRFLTLNTMFTARLLKR